MRRLQQAKGPRPLDCNVIGPGSSPRTAPGRGHYSEPQVGPNGCQSFRGPKARGGARQGNWSILTLKPRPVAGGSWSGRPTETNREPRLSIRNKAGGGTRSQAGSHRDWCSLVGGRPDPDPACARVAPVLINRFPSREIRKKKKKKKASAFLPFMPQPFCPQLWKCASFFRVNYSELCIACAKGFECAGIVRPTLLCSADSERKTQCHIRLWGQSACHQDKLGPLTMRLRNIS